jgi:hypothetical protein
VVEKLNPEYCDYGSGISVELTLWTIVGEECLAKCARKRDDVNAWFRLLDNEELHNLYKSLLLLG